MYFYSETAGASNNIVPYHRQNATKRYLTHYSNILFLKFVIANSNDRAERQQATLEIPIGERKLKHWERHPNFDKDEAAREVAKMKREWAGERKQAA